MCRPWISESSDTTLVSKLVASAQTSPTRLAGQEWTWEVKTPWRPPAPTMSWPSFTPLLRLAHRSSLASSLESKGRGQQAPGCITGPTGIWVTQGILYNLNHKKRYSQFEPTILKFQEKFPMTSDTTLNTTTSWMASSFGFQAACQRALVVQSQ